MESPWPDHYRTVVENPKFGKIPGKSENEIFTFWRVQYLQTILILIHIIFHKKIKSSIILLLSIIGYEPTIGL
jgi:hypothetical protein